MTNFSGVLVDLYDVCDEYARAVPSGTPAGFPVPSTDTTTGDWAAGGATGIAAGTDDFDGLDAPYLTLRKDWFDRVHILPRSEIDFGNVVTRVLREFEIFNAWGVPVDLDTIVENAGAGVDVVSPPSLPATIPAYVSLLDPSSTRFDPVLYDVEALASGAPRFDGDIEFDFSTSEVLELLVRGSRIVFFASEPEVPFVERLTFNTDVRARVDGSEQRTAARANFRQFFDYVILADEYDRRALQSQLYGWLSKTFAIPLWHERVLTTSDVIVGATTLACSSTADVDFRDAGFAVIYESPTKYDVLVLDSVGANSLSFTSSPLLNNYSSGATVMPIRVAFFQKNLQGSRYVRDLEKFVASFQVLDNTTGAPAGSTSGWDTYGGYVLLDDPNVVQQDETPEGWTQRTYLLDSDVGVVNVTSRWDYSRHSSVKGFRCQNRAAVLKLRRLLLALYGRQKAFYLPTFAEDLTVVADIANGGVTLDVENVGYTRFTQNRQNRSIVRVTFTDGTTLTRGVDSSLEVSDTVERLSLDSTWPADRAVDEVSRVEFFELCRFDTDQFSLRYERFGLASVTAPVVSVTA